MIKKNYKFQFEFIIYSKNLEVMEPSSDRHNKMKPIKFPIIKTNRLKLLELNEAHIPDLFKLHRDAEAMKYWDAFPQKDLREAKKLLKLYSTRYKKGTGICWGITLKRDNDESPELIGLISYNRYSENGLGIIGYLLNREYWNRGLMTEAATAFIKFGFKQLKLHRIEAHVTPGNMVSEKLLVKLGFLKEGLLREREFYKGEHQSVIVYGKLKTDN